MQTKESRNTLRRSEVPAVFALSTERESMGESFYKSKRWERTRARILRRDGYQCQIAKRYGKRIPANTVHHIFPRDKFPQYQWEPWNLIAVSHDKHNQLHIRATGELSEQGLELMKRTARRQGIELEESNGKDI